MLQHKIRRHRHADTSHERDAWDGRSRRRARQGLAGPRHHHRRLHLRAGRTFRNLRQVGHRGKRGSQVGQGCGQRSDHRGWRKVHSRIHKSTGESNYANKQVNLCQLSRNSNATSLCGVYVNSFDNASNFFSYFISKDLMGIFKTYRNM